MVKSILATLDGSPLAEAVLPYVAAIGGGLESRVVLANAVDPEDWLDLPHLWDSVEKASREYLNGQAKRLGELDIPVTTRVLHGKAADAILEHAEGEAPDLIAMSTHGRSGLSRVVLGSVAGRVLHGARAPLLLVHPKDDVREPVARLTDIVVPLDASELGETALPLARLLARRLSLNVSLVMALPTSSQLYLGTEFVAHPADIMERTEEAANSYLGDVARRVEEEDGLNVRWQVLRGDAGNAIVEYARDLPDNLVAMSTHGRSGLGRWVLGSVTDKVVRSSGDPVLVVRPNRP